MLLMCGLARTSASAGNLAAFLRLVSRLRLLSGLGGPRDLNRIGRLGEEPLAAPAQFSGVGFVGAIHENGRPLGGVPFLPDGPRAVLDDGFRDTFNEVGDAELVSEAPEHAWAESFDRG